MAQTLDIKPQEAERGEHTLTQEVVRPRRVPEHESPVDRFVSELRRMTPEERIEASRYTMNLRERSVYAARYPEEVPTVNGELEWIAWNLV